jgi:acyl carrier protein
MATRAEITSGLAEILEEVAGVNPDDVAEEKFGVKIPDNEVQNLKTVGDAVSYIEANH